MAGDNYQEEHYEVRENDLKDGSVLHRTRTAGAISLSPEMFEKLYLSPQNRVVGHLRGQFANPTPFALAGFVLSLTPLSIDLMGWRGAGGVGYASIGQFYFMGGLLSIIGAVLEFVLGNTFNCVTFGTFGGFFLAFASTLHPAFNAFGAYSPDPANPMEGLHSPGFNASFGFVFLFMGLISFLFMICSLRVNICQVFKFFTIFFGFTLLAASFWYNAEGKHEHGHTLLVVAAAFIFAGCMNGWYVLTAQLFEAVDFPISLPVGDLSSRFKGARARKEKV